MSKTGLRAFEDALKADEALRKRYEDALKGIAEGGGAVGDGEAMVKAAAQLGYEVSLEELEQAWAAGQELDVSELDRVGGGETGVIVGDFEDDEYGHSGWCFTAWHCVVATLHTRSESHHVLCWSDYQCIYTFHPEEPIEKKES